METSIPLSFVEVYYGGAPVAVPFKWESQPGTPRVRIRETALPPLTPPPSVLFNSLKPPSNKNPKLKRGLLRRLTATSKSRSSSSSQSTGSFPPRSYSESSSLPLYAPVSCTQSRGKSFEGDRKSQPVEQTEMARYKLCCSEKKNDNKRILLLQEIPHAIDMRLISNFM
ncbi:hypothetical protein L6452_37865 [Arctium lappa]|uniref:Uncharacterized protein n=1 Tax=Arctium lappa TaxID=4217 RepID=A0ACB8Y8B1_ARCLA|nr:hypothetical protein L6452_37865 [Arctium lappa]